MRFKSTIKEERAALAAVIGTIGELTPYPYWPDNIETPAGLIRPVKRTDDVMFGEPTRTYEIELLQLAGDQESAQELLDEYIEEWGPKSLRQLLEGNPTLGGLVGNLRFDGWRDYGGRKTEAASFIGVVVDVTLYPKTDDD